MHYIHHRNSNRKNNKSSPHTKQGHYTYYPKPLPVKVFPVHKNTGLKKKLYKTTTESEREGLLRSGDFLPYDSIYRPGYLAKTPNWDQYNNMKAAVPREIGVCWVVWWGGNFGLLGGLGLWLWVWGFRISRFGVEGL